MKISILAAAVSKILYIFGLVNGICYKNGRENSNVARYRLAALSNGLKAKREVSKVMRLFCNRKKIVK